MKKISLKGRTINLIDEFDGLLGEIAEEDIPEYIKDFEELKKPKIALPPLSVRKKNRHWGPVPTNAETLYFNKAILRWWTCAPEDEREKFKPELAKEMALLGPEHMSNGQKYALRNQYIEFHMGNDIFLHTNTKEY